MNLSAEDKAKFKDPNWRLENLYKIKTKNQNIVKFKKNPVQQSIQNQSTNMDVILKARQMGVSTYYLLKLLDRAIFTKNHTVAIVSHERKSMEILFGIIRRAHKLMDPSVKPELAKGGGSIYQMIFPDMESRIYCTLEGVSDTINSLHVSEYALMQNPERVRTSMDAVPADGNISIETTCRGFNFFYDLWNETNNVFQKMFFPWMLQLEYQIESEPLKLTPEEKLLCKNTLKDYGLKLTHNQIAWRRWKIKQKGDMDNFLQEFPEDPHTCFIASGQNFFDLRIISRIKEDTAAFTDEGNLHIYKKFIKGNDYVLGADTAEGVGGDYSVATMIDATTMEQVAQLRGQFKPSDFAHAINDLCKQYHIGNEVWPYVAIERNNHGHAVLLELYEHINYPNLYFHKDERPGWVTDRVSKPIMLNCLKDGLENYTFKPYSHDLLSESLTLINNNGKIGASEGKHDDCVISAAIALQMAIKYQTVNYDNIESRILL